MAESAASILTVRCSRRCRNRVRVWSTSLTLQLDKDGFLYLADAERSLIVKLAPTGEVLSTFGARVGHVPTARYGDRS